MEGSRLKQPIDPEYVQELGVALFCFSICEWNAVYCAERIKPGSLKKLMSDESTAGKIARKLGNLVESMPRCPEKAELKLATQQFSDVVELRNRLIHAKPCTNPGGKARLSASRIYEINDLKEASDKFSTCSIELNRLLHGFLASYQP